jgi:photosystem II stability/assembly factor-like uncharacterized protein
MLPSLRRVLAVTVVAGALVAGTGAASVAQRAPDAAAGRGSLSLSWELTPTGSAARLRGLSAVSRTVAWAGGADGTGGTVLRTTDGGATWASVGPPGTRDLQFRDIEATSDRHAVILSIGGGDLSKIYVTDDGGSSWTLAFQNRDPKAFYDCMAFSTPQRGLAVSDPVDRDHVFRLQETTDGGHTWSLVDPSGMPPTQENEFAFAASGTCLTAGQGQTTYLASGGIDPPRIFVSKDRGHTWSVTAAPLVGGPSAGVFSVRFRDRHNGIAVGGDFANPTSSLGNAAWSSDGGITWRPASVRPAGYRSGSAWLPHERDVALAVGPSGSDVTADAGRTWSPFDSGSFDSVDCSSDGACWASGEQGRVAKLVVSR